ncbi:unnamed protein product [Amaranthus hypochondriacus]
MQQIQIKILLICIIISFCYGCPGNLSTISFNEGFWKVYGDNNILIINNGSSIFLSLDNKTGGSGFGSQNLYENGLFSASIKLPSQNYTAGVVVAFYLQNNNTDPSIQHDQHDEIDFEFLGHPNGANWTLQTNFYGNGSTARGREERYNLWFDPSEEAHKYSIFWSENRVIFYVDDVPIRVVPNIDGLGGDYPSKPMWLFTTIWDASGWATGGVYKINHTFDPFVGGFSDFVMHGCKYDPIQCDGSDYLKDCGEITYQILEAYEKFRNTYLTYTYCRDKSRYSTPFPECLFSLSSMIDGGMY